MLNYLKFATYQIFGFSCSIPKLNKIKKNPDMKKNMKDISKKWVIQSCRKDEI